MRHGLLFALFVACCAAAQEQPRFRSGVQLVLMDVTVLDRNRTCVRGLRASDFTVVEESTPQPIVSFTEVNVPEADGALVPWMRDVAPDVRINTSEDRRVVLIVLDDATVPFQWTKYVKTIARAIVDRLGPTDVASVVYTSDQDKGQDLTSDRARLRAAIDRYSDKSIPGELQTRYSVGTLRRIVEYMMEVPQRRKALFFVSKLQLDLAAGGAASDLSQLGAAEAVATMRDRRAEISDLMRKAARANVSIYPVNPAGLELDETGAGSTAETLQMIGNATGGFAIVNRNNFEAPITQVFRESSAYYVLGFQSSSADGKFRRIDVRVNRPGLTILTRSGYVAPRPDEGKTVGTTAALTKALSGLLPASDMPLRVSSAPFALPTGNDSALAIVLGVREMVPVNGAPPPETVELLASAFGPDGKMRATRRLTARLVLRASEDHEARYEVLSRLDLKPGRYELRIAARSTTLATSGSVYQYVDVPDFTKSPLSLSGIVMGVTPSVAAAPKDFLQPLLPIVPTTQREFVREVHQPVAFVRAYTGGKAPAQSVPVTVKITDERNEQVFGTTTPLEMQAFGPIRAADYLLPLRTSELRPGPYLLTIEAGSGSRSVRRDVRFAVR